MDTRIGVHGERSPIEEARLIEPALKRALYEGFERVHATKAALYSPRATARTTRSSS